MKNKSYIKLKCIFCGSEDFSLPEKNYEPKAGEQIKCANCGKLNDYEELQKHAIEDVAKVFNRDIIDYVKIVNHNDTDCTSDNVSESLGTTDEAAFEYKPDELNEEETEYNFDNLETTEKKSIISRIPFSKIFFWCKMLVLNTINVLLWCLNIGIYVLLIPLKIVLWFLEISMFGYKAVCQRDELERIMRENKDN